jgi:hypothetical protein
MRTVVDRAEDRLNSKAINQTTVQEKGAAGTSAEDWHGKRRPLFHCCQELRENTD